MSRITAERASVAARTIPTASSPGEPCRSSAQAEWRPGGRASPRALNDSCSEHRSKGSARPGRGPSRSDPLRRSSSPVEPLVVND